jgi:methionyl-tRNA formyltransferase
MNLTAQNSCNIAFFSSSDFTITLLQSIVESEGKFLFDIAKKQYDNLIELYKNNIHPKSVLSLPENFWDSSFLQKKIHLEIVISQPNRILRNTTVSNPISDFANSHLLPLYTPEKINNEVSLFSSLAKNLDIAIVASYGQILSEHILTVPSYGMINWHPSKLPLYRGPSPVQTTLKNGDSTTSLSWIEMNETMDAGDIYLQIDTNISQADIFRDVIQNLSKIGSNSWALVIALKIAEQEKMENNEIILYDYIPMRQDYGMVTKTSLIKKTDKFIDHKTHSNIAVYNHFRAFHEFPGTWIESEYFGDAIKLVSVIKPISHHDFDKLQEKCSQLIHKNEWFVLDIDSKQRTFLRCEEGYLEVQEICLSSGKQIQFSGFQFEK